MGIFERLKEALLGPEEHQNAQNPIVDVADGALAVALLNPISKRLIDAAQAVVNNTGISGGLPTGWDSLGALPRQAGLPQTAEALAAIAAQNASAYSSSPRK